MSGGYEVQREGDVQSGTVQSECVKVLGIWNVHSGHERARRLLRSRFEQMHMVSCLSVRAQAQREIAVALADVHCVRQSMRSPTRARKCPTMTAPAPVPRLSLSLKFS